MEDYGFQVARADLLERDGRFGDAAELHLAEGHVLRAIELFVKDTQKNGASSRRAEECLLDSLWQHLSFAVVVMAQGNLSSTQLGELLSWAHKMGKGLSPKALDEVSCIISPLSLPESDTVKVAMFRTICGVHTADLMDLGIKFRDVHNDPFAALLCLDHAFTKGLKLQAANCFEVASVLSAFVVYTRELASRIVEPEPLKQAASQRLFGFCPTGDLNPSVRLRAGTFLHAARLRSSRLPGKVSRKVPDTEDLVLTQVDFKKLFKDALADRLIARIRSENQVCRTAPAFRPCASNIVFGSCFRNSCPDNHQSADINIELYRARLRIVFQQIMIYETLHAVDQTLVEITDQRCVRVMARWHHP